MNYVHVGITAIKAGEVMARMYPTVCPIDAPMRHVLQPEDNPANLYVVRTWPLEAAPDVSMAEPDAQTLPDWRWMTVEFERNADRIGAAPALLYIGTPSMPAGLVRYITPRWQRDTPQGRMIPPGSDVWSLVFETQ